MSSPTLTDKQLEMEYGRRQSGVQPLDEPQELGYICPKGHSGDYLYWSEFKEHIWCYKCKVDCHYAADCQLRRMCWMTDEQWRDFLKRLPMKPKIIGGIRHFPDCEISHKASMAGKISAERRYGKTTEQVSIPITPSPKSEPLVTDELRTEFKDLDIDEELKKFTLYWSEGKRKLQRPKTAFRNWLTKAREFKQGKQPAKPVRRTYDDGDNMEEMVIL